MGQSSLLLTAPCPALGRLETPPKLPQPRLSCRVIPQVGGIYTTDLPLLEEQPAAQQVQAQPPQHPEVRGLAAPNISVSLKPACGSDKTGQDQQQQQRLVLRLWAEREGPLDEVFTLALPPQHEVRCGRPSHRMQLRGAHPPSCRASDRSCTRPPLPAAACLCSTVASPSSPRHPPPSPSGGGAGHGHRLLPQEGHPRPEAARALPGLQRRRRHRGRLRLAGLRRCPADQPAAAAGRRLASPTSRLQLHSRAGRVPQPGSRLASRSRATVRPQPPQPAAALLRRACGRQGGSAAACMRWRLAAWHRPRQAALHRQPVHSELLVAAAAAPHAVCLCTDSRSCSSHRSRPVGSADGTA